MVSYQKLYAYLVGEIDAALTLLDTDDLLQFQRIRDILSNALQTAEEMYLEDTETDEE